MSDVAAVALLAHLEKSWLYQKVALGGECAQSFRNDLGVINFQWHSSPPSFHNAEAFGLVSEGRAPLHSAPALEICYCKGEFSFPLKVESSNFMFCFNLFYFTRNTNKNSPPCYMG